MHSIVFGKCIYIYYYICFIILNYFASSDPHHDISKQLVDTTFV